MHRFLIGYALVGVLLTAAVAKADPVPVTAGFQLAGGNSGVTFSGSSFSFNDGAQLIGTNNPNVQITPQFYMNKFNTQDPGLPVVYGRIDGSFTYTLNTLPGGGVDVNNATVTGTEVFTLDDGLGTSTSLLTANVTFMTLQSFQDGFDSGGVFVSNTGILNLTGITYTGSNTNLQQLAGLGSVSLTATFSQYTSQFLDLQGLQSVGGLAQEANLTLTDPVVPAPASWLTLLSGSSLLGSFGWFRRRRALRLA